MLLRRTIFVATLASAFAMTTAGTATAGSGVFKNSKGKTVSIRCNNSGCKVNGRRVGPGGRSNYEKLVWQWGRKGYK